MNQMTMTLQLTCDRCNNLIPVNGPVLAVKCSRCGKKHSLTPSILASVISHATRNEHLPNLYSITIHDGPGPACTNCNTTLPVIDLKNKNQNKPMRCPGCGMGIDCAAPPQWMKRIFPEISFVVNADIEVKNKRPVRSLLLSCISCGAALTLNTGDDRFMTCSFCGRTMFLTASAWRLLHSVDTVRSWSIVYSGKMLKKVEDTCSKDEPVISAAENNLVALKWFISCVKCGGTIPVNGPFRKVWCQDCGNIQRIKPRLIAETLVSASQGSSVTLLGEKIFGYSFDDNRPHCHTCENPVDIAAHIKNGKYSDSIYCNSCGEKLPGAPVPLWLKPHLKGSRYFFGTDTISGISSNKNNPLELSLFCETCGSENDVHADASLPRVIQCRKCKWNIVLPVEIWRRYHPVKTLQKWSLLYNVTGLSRRILLRERISDLYQWNLRYDWEDRIETLQKIMITLRKILLRERIRSLTVMMNFRCPGCGKPVPINGPHLTVTCSHCMKKITLSAEQLAYDIYLASKNMGRINFGNTGNQLINHSWRKTIPCSACSAPVEIPISKLATGNNAEVQCPSCSAPMKGGPPPQWMKNEFPEIMGIFNWGKDTPRTGKKRAVEQQGNSTASIDCPGCGNYLEINSKKRAEYCATCKINVIIPEDVWHRLHPAVTVIPWAIIFRGEGLKEFEGPGGFVGYKPPV